MVDVRVAGTLAGAKDEEEIEIKIAMLKKLLVGEYKAHRNFEGVVASHSFIYDNINDWVSDITILNDIMTSFQATKYTNYTIKYDIFILTTHLRNSNF